MLQDGAGVFVAGDGLDHFDIGCFVQDRRHHVMREGYVHC